MNNFVRILVILVIAGLVATETSAQTVIGNFGDWTVFKDSTGKNRVCYIVSEPKKETGKYKSRGDTYIMLTSRPAEKSRDVFELRAGYSYKKASEVAVRISNRVFTLFTDGGTAWAYDSKVDRALARAMIGGRDMLVTGYSSRGNKTVDTYSLTGFTAAYKAMNKACGLR